VRAYYLAEDDRGRLVDLLVEADGALQRGVRVRCSERHRECDRAEE